MTFQNRPLCPRSNIIKDSEIPKYIGKLKRFLGYEALAKTQADLDKDLSHHGGCYRIWAQHLKPWLFAFRTYDQITIMASILHALGQQIFANWLAMHLWSLLSITACRKRSGTNIVKISC
jgi:hypothetical protein